MDWRCFFFSKDVRNSGSFPFLLLQYFTGYYKAFPAFTCYQAGWIFVDTYDVTDAFKTDQATIPALPVTAFSTEKTKQFKTLEQKKEAKRASRAASNIRRESCTCGDVAKREGIAKWTGS